MDIEVSFPSSSMVSKVCEESIYFFLKEKQRSMNFWEVSMRDAYRWESFCPVSLRKVLQS